MRSHPRNVVVHLVVVLVRELINTLEAELLEQGELRSQKADASYLR
jgi:hypothetical protein